MPNPVPDPSASTSDRESSAASPRDERPYWRRAFPFALAISLTAYLVSKMDLPAFVRHLRGVNYPAFLAFCLVFCILLLGADSLATSFVYSRAVCRIRIRDLFLARGASYLPSLVNHHLGQAWLTWYLSRAHKAPLWRVAGATLIVYGTVFGWLAVLGSLSLFFEQDQAWWLAPVLAVIGACGLGYLLVIRLKPAWLLKRQVLAPLFEVGVVGHFQAFALRLPHMLVLFVGSWLPFRFFGVDIPPGAALTFVPILMVVAALPITPQGLGTRDWFATHFFARFGPGEHAEQVSAILATTLSFILAISLFQLIFSLVLMHRALRVLGPSTDAVTDANATGTEPR